MSKLTTIITRGKILESLHQVKCHIGSLNGKIIFSTNNEKDIIYYDKAAGHDITFDEIIYTVITSRDVVLVE